MAEAEAEASALGLVVVLEEASLAADLEPGTVVLAVAFVVEPVCFAAAPVAVGHAAAAVVVMEMLELVVPSQRLLF